LLKSDRDIPSGKRREGFRTYISGKEDYERRSLMREMLEQGRAALFSRRKRQAGTRVEGGGKENLSSTRKERMSQSLRLSTEKKKRDFSDRRKKVSSPASILEEGGRRTPFRLWGGEEITQAASFPAAGEKRSVKQSLRAGILGFSR